MVYNNSNTICKLLNSIFVKLFFCYHPSSYYSRYVPRPNVLIEYHIIIKHP